MTASIWSTLGIPEGSERDAIRRGYARKLREVHPEDDPEGFKALRDAYEQALRQAEWASYEGDEEEEEKESASDEDVLDQELTSPFALEERSTARWGAAQPTDLAAPVDGLFDDAADRAELDAAMRDFHARLDPEAPTDPDGLIDAFHRLRVSPMMNRIDARAGVEAWIAATVADNIPRSDPVIETAIETFGWDAADVYRGGDYYVSAVLQRVEEWNVMAGLQRPEDALHRGWRALTDPPVAPWRMRLAAWSASLSAQASQLLAHAAYEMPGLRFHMEPTRVEWWQRHLSRARHSLGTLALAPLFVWAATTAALAFTSDRRLVGYAALAAVPLALAVPTLWLRLVKQRQHDWRHGERPDPPGWFSDGWIALAGLLPLLAMLLPGSYPGVAVAYGLSIILILWTAVAQPPAPADARLAVRFGRLLTRLWSPFLVGMLTLGAIGSAGDHFSDIWGTVAAAILFAWLRGREAITHALAGVLQRVKLPGTYWIVPALVTLSQIAAALRPDVPAFFFAALASLLCLPMLPLLAAVEPGANKIALFACFFLAVGNFFGTMDLPDTPDTPVTQSLPEAQAKCGAGFFPNPDGVCVPLSSTLPDKAPAPLADTPTPPSPRDLLPPAPPPAAKPKPAICPKLPPAMAKGPRPPIPCGTPLSWVTSDDYPKSALREGRAGTTKFDLEISAKGKLTGCTITGSSGTTALDRATCRLMRERARFLPAQDADGKPAPSTLRTSFKWQIEG